MKFCRLFIQGNTWLSSAIDQLLPARLREDGNRFFRNMIPHEIGAGTVVYDFGGGSRPCVGISSKRDRNVTLVGIDISEEELAKAPAGTYDEIIVTDICRYVGTAKADTIICQATLEHVRDTRGALRAIATTLKPGGRALIFAPSRNAVFARLNLLLPQRVKERLLFALLPHKADGHDGFRAYYDQCTPGRVTAIMHELGLEIEDRRVFWKSSYFFIFFPAYMVWRLYQASAYLLLGDNAAETFIVIARRPD